MKDLYKRLGIDDHATQRQIEFALQHSDDDAISADGEYVLLNAARRMVYDRNHRTLKLVGALRRRLQLDNTPHWDPIEYQDYLNAEVPEGRSREPAVHLEAPDWIENATMRFWVLFGFFIVLYTFLYFLFQ